MKERIPKRTETKKLVLCAVLSALIVVMTVVPYTGYISYGLVEITTLHIVVAIGAVCLGAKYGMILGLVWGVTCLLRAFTNPAWALFTNPLISVLPRVLVGAAGGTVYYGLSKTRMKKQLAACLAAAAATVTNTVLVLLAINLFGGMMKSYAAVFEAVKGALLYIATANGVLELVAAMLIVPAVFTAITPRALVLGIDIGASTTKLALIRSGRVVRAVRKPDGQTLDEALAEFGVSGVKRVAVTGVGARALGSTVRGVPATLVDEFDALSKGAASCGKCASCLVVSVGTGTSFVRVTPLHAWHVGGTGMGGGLLAGLSERLLGLSDISELQALAREGDLSKVDLQLADVCEGKLRNMTGETTVANLQKLNPEASRADLAKGLCNLIFESIGVMAAFAGKTQITHRIVVVGTITDWPVAAESLARVAKLHNVRFIVPEDAPFATAIGAALMLE